MYNMYLISRILYVQFNLKKCFNYILIFLEINKTFIEELQMQTLFSLFIYFQIWQGFQLHGHSHYCSLDAVNDNKKVRLKEANLIKSQVTITSSSPMPTFE